MPPGVDVLRLAVGDGATLIDDLQAAGLTDVRGREHPLIAP